jgi:hypothetical protein
MPRAVLLGQPQVRSNIRRCLCDSAHLLLQLIYGAHMVEETKQDKGKAFNKLEVRI